MGIVELIEIALANADDRRVELTALEPAEFAPEAVGDLVQLVFELVSNAIASSGWEEKVHVGGSFDDETYLISVSARGVGGSDYAIGVLNRMLENPELTLDIASVARLAARHGLTVRLVPGAQGTSARVTVPSHLVSWVDSGAGRRAVKWHDAEAKPPVEFIAHELGTRAASGHLATRSVWRDSEAFLEEVFAPLLRERQDSVRLVTSSIAIGGNGWGDQASTLERESHGTVTVLRVRVPGESFHLAEDDSPSTAAAEGAVDIRSALSTFDAGRRSAEHAG